jgi:hypothetical protein
MTDRELLEAAARAAGMNVGNAQHGVWFYCEHGGSGSGFYRVSGNIYEYWNPLTDDGDALRLAVALRMTVCIIGEGMAEADTDVSPRVHEYCVDDTAAATRRAIVKAAAGMIKHGTP